MTSLRQTALLKGVIVAVTVIAVFIGWRLFWFLTDDAFISFRYARNSLLGYGLVWNPPPFQPVEGYTNLLWILLLKWIWQITGIAPPDTANWISLAFGYGTLSIGYLLLKEMKLPDSLSRCRDWLFALVLLGTVTNRTFLAWLSSGLETSLLNFLITVWIYLAIREDNPTNLWWPTSLAVTASLMALTRPDGLLFFAATVLILFANFRFLTKRSLLLAIPFFVIVPVHLVFRHSFYGLWLPNTYYAKTNGVWPESGLRYLFSFVFEYGIWFWLLLALAVLIRMARKQIPEPSFVNKTKLFVVLSLLAHIGYYTLVIGGDHFEYRVYSHLILLVFLSGIWLASRISSRIGVVFATTLIFVFFSWPIPWIHWQYTKNLSTRKDTQILIYPVAPHFPFLFRKPIAIWDGWQSWLIRHYVCMRHQEHKIFFQFQWDLWMPVAEKYESIPWTKRTIVPLDGVGVPAWLLPGVAVLDKLGLNDRVIARIPANPGYVRRMAHDRFAPPVYIDCFKPNAVFSSGQFILLPRTESPAETDQRILSCEQQFAHAAWHWN